MYFTFTFWMLEIFASSVKEKRARSRQTTHTHKKIKSFMRNVPFWELWMWNKKKRVVICYVYLLCGSAYFIFYIVLLRGKYIIQADLNETAKPISEIRFLRRKAEIFATFTILNTFYCTKEYKTGNKLLRTPTNTHIFLEGSC